MAGKGGGAWKVAYADFVTAMMAFFMVMWITAQSKPVKQAVAEYFEDPLGMNRGSRSTSLKGPEDSTTIGPYMSGRGPARGLAMADLKTDGDRNPRGVAARKPPKVIIFRHMNRTRSLGTIVQFPEDSAELTEDARQRLEDLIPMLLGKLNKIEIRFYTPRRPLATEGKFQSFWELGHARCLATMAYLAQRGIPEARIRLSQDGQLEPGSPTPELDKDVDRWGVEIFALDEYVNH